jgi:hypothetical protein
MNPCLDSSVLYTDWEIAMTKPRRPKLFDLVAVTRRPDSVSWATWYSSVATARWPGSQFLRRGGGHAASRPSTNDVNSKPRTHESCVTHRLRGNHETRWPGATDGTLHRTRPKIHGNRRFAARVLVAHVLNGRRWHGLGLDHREWNSSVSRAIREAVQLASQALLRHPDEFIAEPVPA